MDLKEYSALVERRYGPIKLPEFSEELTDIKEALENGFESVSKSDYLVLQGIKIIECWGKLNELPCRKERLDN